jgi:hypothetical protein
MSRIASIAKHFGRPTLPEVIIAVCAVLALWQIVLYRDTAKKQLRAYVMATGCVQKTTDESKAGCCVEITIRNSGQTPSYETSVRLCNIWYGGLPTEQPAYSGSPPFSLAPQEEKHMALTTPPDKPPHCNTGQPLHFSGVIYYKDIYNIQHKSSFHFVSHSAVDPAASTAMVYAAEGNEAE